MSESVLERSVLERKERDELQAIARAMGAQPPARARKADLVDLILTTAGITPTAAASGDGDAVGNGPAGNGAVEVNGAVETPEAPPVKPRRRSRASSAAAGDSGLAGAGANSVDAPAADANGADATAAGATGAGANGSEPGAGTDDATASAADVTETSSTSGAGGDQAATSDRPEARSVGDDERPGGQSGDRGSGTGGAGDRDRGDRDRERNRGSRGDVRPGDGGDLGEGNRRRRRRGRDRDRGQGGQGGQVGQVNQGGPADRAPSDQRADEAWSGEPVACSGLLDLRDEGYGFLRTKGYLASADDIYVSVKQVRQFGLRKGDHLTGTSRPANRTEKNPALLRVDQVNGKDPEEARRRPRFEDLTPLFPDQVLRLETPGDATNMTARIVDLVAPIGKGQRGLIVSPPKAGKTTIMKQIVKSIEANNPDVHLMVLLVDERPEEVTDMRRSTGGEVIASTFDRPSDEHTQVTELGIERAKRLVEDGRDVVIILDGITRLARAYNLAAPATGRIMSGGIDTGALYPPKKFFGAARNIEEGALTILATALIETGSKMDEVIFEEFKGTGNMELRLDRRLAERRIYPAIDVDASSTRHEELLFDRKQLQQVWRVRRALNALSADGASPSAALERLMDGMRTFSSNEQFLAEAAKAGGPGA